MATKRALLAAKRARDAVERELQRWDGILTAEDFRRSHRDIAHRAAKAAIAAWRRTMEAPRDE